MSYTGSNTEEEFKPTIEGQETEIEGKEVNAYPLEFINKLK